MQDEEEREFLVYAEVKMRGAWMTITAKTADEAKEKADANPDFECGGAELSDWKITGVSEGL
jgi:hypothetical protein